MAQMQHMFTPFSETMYFCILRRFSVCSSRVYQEARGRLVGVSNWFCVQVKALKLQALQRWMGFGSWDAPHDEQTKHLQHLGKKKRKNNETICCTIIENWLLNIWSQCSPLTWSRILILFSFVLFLSPF